MVLKVFSLYLILGISPLMAAQSLVMNEHERLDVRVSSKELNRIQVKGDRIASVFGAQGFYSLESDDVKGQIFLKVHEGVPSRFDISVVTESGRTQDLSLKVIKGEGQTLLLMPSSSPSTETWPSSSGVLPESLALLKAMAASHQDAGYKREHLSKLVPLWRDMDVTLREIWQGEELEGRVYQITNRSSHPQRLHEKQFRVLPRLKAIALEKHLLIPGASLTVYVVVSHA